MRKGAYALLLLVLVAASFLAGAWYSGRLSGRSGPAEGRRILHYVDPMHPAYTSDKPGIAPDCGMQLEPVYADGGPGPAGSGGSGPVPSGTVTITSEKQQMIGVRVAPVEKASGTHALRILGRVAADETRIYRINAAVDGWIRHAYPNSVGSLVRKDEILAAYFAPEFLGAMQAYIYALGAMDRYQSTGKETPAQIASTNLNIKQYRDALANMGMGDRQIDEMANTRKITESVMITAPETGFVLVRNVSPGQRFERGAELYRIADLSRVWILADLFENEARYLRPGMWVTASLPRQGRAFRARVSDVPPQFEPSTRTLKVRLLADNRDLALRPDMFVDIELPVRYSPTIAVPADAVLDSGLRKTVFVERGNGIFEPRKVETGWRLGERVEIVKGLMPGERIVVSGNFLVDSESRLKAAAAGIYGEAQKDPVCGMEVDEAKGRAAGRTSESGMKTYFFCSDGCKQAFDREPGRYTGKKGGAGKPKPHGAPAVRTVAAGGPIAMADPPAVAAANPPLPAAPVDPVCGMTVDEAGARAAGRFSEHMGKTYFFCADGCKQAFDREPGRYLSETGSRHP